MAEQVTRGWQRPSIYDVAKLAGVSHMTVSRVLNDHPNIRESTRQRVLDAIDQTNTRQLHRARPGDPTRDADRRGRRHPAAVRPEQHDPALESAAREAGYAISAFSAGDDEDLRIDAGVDELVAQGVDALCVIAPRLSSLDLLRQRETGVPTLIIKSEPDADMRHGGRRPARRRDARDGPPARTGPPLDRARRRAARLVRRPRPRGGVARVARRGGTARDGCRDRRLVVRLRLRVRQVHDFGDATAIFAANDQMALGLIHGLTARGLRVPEDISIVGFDDLPDSRHYLPPLTTVRQDFAALGALALELLVAAIEETPTPDSQMIEPRLIVRESTARPRA